MYNMEQTRDRSLAIAADTERLRNLIETVPPAQIDILHQWRVTLTQIQTHYVQAVREYDRALAEQENRDA
jgi:hypothetical protein